MVNNWLATLETNILNIKQLRALNPSIYRANDKTEVEHSWLDWLILGVKIDRFVRRENKISLFRSDYTWQNGYSQEPEEFDWQSFDGRLCFIQYAEYCVNTELYFQYSGIFNWWKFHENNTCNVTHIPDNQVIHFD